MESKEVYLKMCGASNDVEINVVMMSIMFVRENEIITVLNNVNRGVNTCMPFISWYVKLILETSPCYH